MISSFSSTRIDTIVDGFGVVEEGVVVDEGVEEEGKEEGVEEEGKEEEGLEEVVRGSKGRDSGSAELEVRIERNGDPERAKVNLLATLSFVR